jgi:hypothetical protein
MMRTAMLAFATASALGAGGAMAVNAAQTAPRVELASTFTEEAHVAPKRIVIGLDISRSNPLVSDSAFAAKVGARIADEIRTLGFASEVHVRTLGNYDAASNTFYYDAVLSIRSRPEDVAAEVERLISGTPLLVKHGKWKAQSRTNILAFLDNVSQSIGCSGMPTTIILASDGIEDSEYAHLARANSHLPAPDAHEFAGCAKLEILGLGQGTRSPIETVRLRKEWTGWAKAAGFKEFQGLNDW